MNKCKWICKHKLYYQCVIDINNGIYKCNLDKRTLTHRSHSFVDFLLDSNKLIYSKTALENEIYQVLGW